MVYTTVWRILWLRYHRKKLKHFLKFVTKKKTFWQLLCVQHKYPCSAVQKKSHNESKNEGCRNNSFFIDHVLNIATTCFLPSQVSSFHLTIVIHRTSPVYQIQTLALQPLFIQPHLLLPAFSTLSSALF